MEAVNCPLNPQPSSVRNDGPMEPSSRTRLELETDAAVIAGVVGSQVTHGVVPSVIVRKADGEVTGRTCAPWLQRA